MNKNMFAILKNETSDAHQYWMRACQELGLSCQIIDMCSEEWLDKIKAGDFDFSLVCPSSTLSHYKQMYDERLFILENVLGLPLYPSYKEVVIHENKRFLSYWLKANEIPHPRTWVFYDKNEAKKLAAAYELPLIGKINIGASGRGVRIFRDHASLDQYIHDAFTKKGIKQETGPNLKMGGTAKRLVYAMLHPAYIKKRLMVYKNVAADLQRNFVIFQEFIPHDFEWRIVKIGDSYFGHQKIKTGDKASGTKGIDYQYPPVGLLDFVHHICERFAFNSMAIDLFEDGKGGYLINEMQTIFGHVQDHICEKDGKPGRFVLKNGLWCFEEGRFNSNLSYSLRLKNVLDLLGELKK